MGYNPQSLKVNLSLHLMCHIRTNGKRHQLAAGGTQQQTVTVDADSLQPNIDKAKQKHQTFRVKSEEALKIEGTLLL